MSALTIVLFVLGIALLVLGAELLVRGASRLALAAGVSPLVVGLTVVAFGTSAPELAVSVRAAFAGSADIAYGNVVGSNVFNVLCVLGLAGLVAPTGVPVAAQALAFDTPVMIAVSVACLPIFFTGHVIARWEGALFLFFYAAYATLLVLQATASAALPTFQNAMAFFVLPLTVLTLAVLTAQALRRGRAAR